ncbi:hypothetical protein Enr13x_73870 [Stieleria neptunia]|uniref:Uncharacterized protein n=1 Tax=Stieleria neptunia TaxID=2527979 RepID=A0A518I313_9BACT|nr:hypothetical protein [Stieleria neptunia]QDV47478.1 hypothetical protein Enr13x_73870 [Stieleria neptunia]
MIAKLRALVCVVLAGLAIPQVVSADSDAADQETGNEQHLEYLVKRQQAYTLERVSDERIAVLQTSPLFRWDNPISGARGGVFLWTIDERPVAMTKCHVNDRKQHYVESSVFLSDSLLLKYQDQTIWRPKESALKHVSVERDSSPVQSSVGRLVQMRQLAADFAIEDTWGEGDGEPYQLRLIPRPLYRYASKEAGLLDGAVFAFVQGTNPEAVVIVEAIRRNNQVQWHCGISRLTGYALTVERNGNVVYKVPKLNHPDHQNSYRHYWEKPIPYPFQSEKTSGE